jgi:gliding motility-associated-like protein
MFTPNNDKQNDNFLIYGYGLDEEIVFKIFNRWGEVVYSTNSLDELETEGWNGKFNDIDQPGGVYLWTLLANDINGNPVDFSLIDNFNSSGSILLKR